MSANRTVKLLFFLTFFFACLYYAEGQTFGCNSDLYQVVNGNELKKLDPSTGIYTSIGISSISYNGAGFNSEDGFIYGIGQNSRLIRVDNTGKGTDLGAIRDFSALSYSGDFDTLGNWYSFRKAGGNWLMNKVDVSVLPAKAEEYTVLELSGQTNAANCADISYNIKTGKFYGMTSGILIEFDPFALTVKTLEDYSSSAEKGAYGAVWSDNEGNSYFFNNNTGAIYKAIFNEDGTVTSFAYIATSSPNSSNDGMNCVLGAPPVFPEVCDNGIDDDGDGLVDCADPDCASSETCGISGEVINSEFACESSIATYHLFYTNNSELSNSINVTSTLPSGFIFIQDTLEFDAGGSSNHINQPVEGDKGSIRWGQINLNGGETVRISFDVEITGEATHGANPFNFLVGIGNATTRAFPEVLGSSIVVGDCPAPSYYACEPAFYQVYKKRGKNQPNMYGKLDPILGNYDPIAVASDYANGLGYDINSGLVYGASGKRFIQLDQDGLVIDQGIRFNKNVYRGDINEKSEWFGVDGSDMIKIDVSNTPSIVATYPSQGLPGWDMAFNKDGHFYSIHHQTLYRFNTTSHSKEVLGNIEGAGLPASGGYGAQWTGSDGYLYASHNSSGKILRINVKTRAARVVSHSIGGLSKNDGFSCPTQIPVVYGFDYGDNDRLPESRILNYNQDLSHDDIPDFSTVWLGSTVNNDLSDPSNGIATGDSDDGLNLTTEIRDGRISAAIGLNSNVSTEAYLLIGIDWNDDGQIDAVHSENISISSSMTINRFFETPENFEDGNINLRAIIAEIPLDSTHLTGDIETTGEVEDYRIFLSTPCTGANCEVSTGNDGGLESNGNLAGAIAKRAYHRSQQKVNLGRKEFQSALLTYARSRNANDLHHYFPQTGVGEDEEAKVSSPNDLIDLTNANDVFAVDYYRNAQRVAAGLLLETKDEVYNHSKNVCDRLNGKVIENVYLIPVEDVEIIMAKIIDQAGRIEYSGWFSALDQDSTYAAYSHWNVDTYPHGSYLNFQAWSSSASQVLHLLQYALKQLSYDKPVITADKDEQLPSVIVKSGRYEHGNLTLRISNEHHIDRIHLKVNARRTEQSPYTTSGFSLTLNGDKEQEVVVPVGNIFDAGISITSENESSYDALYLADGAWGVDYDPVHSQIFSFQIFDEERTDDVRDQYMVERGFSVSAKSDHVVNVFRNLKAGLGSLDITEYSTLGLNVISDQPVEISLIAEDLIDWEDRLTYTVPASFHQKRRIINLKDFEGYNEQKLVIKTIVFSYLNDSGSNELVSFEIDAITFGNEQTVLSTKEDQLIDNFKIYPNPVKEAATIHFTQQRLEPFILQLFGLDGQLFLTKKGTGIGDISLRLDRNNIPSGIYLLKLHAGNLTQTMKVVFE